MKQLMPNFFVVGAPKAGTTSLYGYLRLHPDVYLPDTKELHYFSHQELLEHDKGPGDKSALQDICRSMYEYKSHYRSNKVYKSVGDISPSYLFYHGAAAEISAICPSAKIIIMLRNPAEKAYSQYCHLVRSGREVLTFRDGLESEGDRVRAKWNDMWHYVSGSRYLEAVNKYLDVFGRNNVKIVYFEEFTTNTSEVMRDICDFLEIGSTYDLGTGHVHNKGMGAMRFGKVVKMVTENRLLRVILTKMPTGIESMVKNAIKPLVFKSKDTIEPSIRNEIIEALREEIMLVEKVVGRKSYWI
ncbi:sulfotransferase [Zhongshania guokunii]|uniref:Sulfotransferase n=1 Tax=Zhongshania guokunii TaxID=641783 RepID=A0ABV3U9L3_9GAMM